MSLARKILSLDDDSPDLESVLESKSARSLLTVRDSTDTNGSPNRSPLVRLLSLLKRRPILSIRVFCWRRKLRDSPPIIAEELASAITMASRARNPLLAHKYFNIYKSLVNGPFLFNVLMTAYMYNGDVEETFLLFYKLQRLTEYGPDTVSYNILLSLCSYRRLVQEMESVFYEMEIYGIPPSIKTYHILIRGYLRSGMWEQMESIFGSLKKPNTSTHLLMLRGYALAGKLEKMERMYELVKREVHTRGRSLIWAMISAYYKVGGESSRRKIIELVKLVGEEEHLYFPHLHMVLISVYTEEGLIDEVKRIFDALNRNMVIGSHRVMRTILAFYLRYGDVRYLDWAIIRAQIVGWNLGTGRVTDPVVKWGY
ncbi:Pentatricopeptide repeat-containing protein [Rhynchospora pubera]|uniref:Pentatricopeptide repeat-containing protein n=1 Tax=Rhynchospora pubera TaxID=906938 RepID=A0AAV8EFB5_9POAL|nr:Pentatricopeptide repeat-containing protein [Rhynchospora pubera]